MAHNEVSVSHPDAIKSLLLRTLPKVQSTTSCDQPLWCGGRGKRSTGGVLTAQQGQWYAIVCFPDYTFTTPFSMLDPKEKNECAKYLSSGYLLHNVLKSEPAMDVNMRKLFGWMDKYAAEQKSMPLDEFFTYVAFDITGEVIFSKPFGTCTPFPIALLFPPHSLTPACPGQASSKRGRTLTAPSP